MTPLEILAILGAAAAFKTGGAAAAAGAAAVAIPNSAYATKNYRWTDLIISGGNPTVAEKYRKLYPGGKWPYFLDPSLWINRYHFVDGQAMSKQMARRLLVRPLSENMREHLENLIEPIRAYLGKPLKIISGWRPPELNQSRGVGGERKSSHMMGIATDIACDSKTKRIAKVWAIKRDRERRDIGLFITYPWGFHLSSLRGFSDHVIK